MISHDDWSRLARFAAEECTAEEAAACARWVGESAERQEALAFIRDANAAARIGMPQWDTSGAWERLAARQSARSGRGRLPSQPRPPLRLTPAAMTRRARWLPRLAAAAAVLVAAGALGVLWRAEALGLGGGVQALAPMRQQSTPRGERVTFQLPDGTLVTLAPESRLRYPLSFKATTGRRDVYLEGQALFHVKHNASRPFLVHTAGGIAEDLGTKFTVQDYPGDSAVQVVVAEGSVELRPQGRTAVKALIRPGQLARLTRAGETTIRSNIDIARHLAWADGQLMFDDTLLRDALPVLGRWYDMDFVLADSSVGGRHLTAELPSGAVAETLELLSSTLDLDYEQHGRIVTFLPRR